MLKYKIKYPKKYYSIIEENRLFDKAIIHTESNAIVTGYLETFLQEGISIEENDSYIIISGYPKPGFSYIITPTITIEFDT